MIAFGIICLPLFPEPKAIPVNPSFLSTEIVSCYQEQLENLFRVYIMTKENRSSFSPSLSALNSPSYRASDAALSIVGIRI